MLGLREAIMMNSALPLPSTELEGAASFDSAEYHGVTFTIRRMTLRQRIYLLTDLHALYREHDFSKAGTSQADRINAHLSSLRIDEIFLRWGVLAIEGLSVDGKRLCVEDLAEYAPEGLVREILFRIRESIALDPGDEKN